MDFEKFFKFNVIKSIHHAPWGADFMRTTWVITEKTNNLSKTESKLRLDFALWGTVSKIFQVQF